jgi:hypothetical protein
MGASERRYVMLTNIPPVPSVHTNEGIFALVKIIPLQKPHPHATTSAIKKAKKPNNSKLNKYTTDMREIIPPTERSIPPVIITKPCPNPTVSKIAVRLPMVFKLYMDKKLLFMSTKMITMIKSSNRAIYIAGSLRI